MHYPEKKGYSARNLAYMCPVSYTHLTLPTSFTV